ncbi:MAG: hypothetical protein J6X53_10350 [Abditibacteriota bacterium]|nr:hypothetical protein [Abditibacteriota bacterium]
MRYREAELHYWEGPFFGGAYRFIVTHDTGDDSWNEVVQAVVPRGDGTWFFEPDEDNPGEDTIIEAPDLDAAMEAAERHYVDDLKAQIADMQTIVDSFVPQEDSGPCHGCGCWDEDTGDCAMPPESRPFTCTVGGANKKRRNAR